MPELWDLKRLGQWGQCRLVGAGIYVHVQEEEMDNCAHEVGGISENSGTDIKMEELMGSLGWWDK